MFRPGAMGTAVAMHAGRRGHDVTVGDRRTTIEPRSADERNLDLPYHAPSHRVLFDGADARDILEVLR